MDWSVMRIADLDSTKNTVKTGPFGSLLHSYDYANDGVPLLLVKHISNGRIIDSDIPRVNWNKANELKQYWLEEGDIVFTRVGAVGRTVHITKKQKGWMFSGQTLRLRIRNPNICNEFIEYYFRSPIAQYISENTSLGTTRPSINTTILSNRFVPIPPLPEQRTIAHILGTLDDKIELNRRMNQTLEETAQALFKSMFVDFDGHDDFVESALGPIPRGWEVRPITEIIEIIGGGTPRRSEKTFWGGNIRWFSVRDAPDESDLFVHNTEECITEIGLENSAARLVPKWTTIISARGTVGKFAIASVPMAFNQSCYGIRSANGYGQIFIHYSLRKLVVNLLQIAHGTSFDTITRSTFENTYIVVPPISTARMFENAIKPALTQILGNGKESRTLTSLRDTLLPKLISGKLRVPEAERMMEAAA